MQPLRGQPAPFPVGPLFGPPARPPAHSPSPHPCLPLPLPLQRVLDTAFHVLYDARRRSCHTLVYNYFVSCGGLRAFVGHFPDVLGLLRQVRRH